MAAPKVSSKWPKSWYLKEQANGAFQMNSFFIEFAKDMHRPACCATPTKI